MAKDPIIFALANPVPEIYPDEAIKEGAFIGNFLIFLIFSWFFNFFIYFFDFFVFSINNFPVATGRSDFPNQVNNSLAFPGLFRGALDTRSTTINREMKIAAAYAIANLINDDSLNRNCMYFFPLLKFRIPNALDTTVPIVVAKAVAEAAIKTGVARKVIDPKEVENNMRTYILERELPNMFRKVKMWVIIYHLSLNCLILWTKSKNLFLLILKFSFISSELFITNPTTDLKLFNYLCLSFSFFSILSLFSIIFLFTSISWIISFASESKFVQPYFVKFGFTFN